MPRPSPVRGRGRPRYQAPEPRRSTKPPGYSRPSSPLSRRKPAPSQEKVGVSYKDYKPPGWEKIMRPTKGPAGVFARRRQEAQPYEASYWENPLNVARNYHALKAAAPGQKPPDFLDPDQIVNAYKYMVHVQGTDDWINWKYLNREDPARGFLQNMSPPPMEWQLKPEDFQRWLAADLGGRDPETWTDEEIGKLTPDLRVNFEEYREMWADKVPFEDLPTWQKMQYNIQQNPVMSGVATMMPFAMAGGVMGLAGGGPVGALLGAGVPLATGAALGALSQANPSVAELLQVLDVPAEWTEKTIGLGLQIHGSMIDPEAFGALSEITDNLDIAHEAGTAAYTTGAFTDYEAWQVDEYFGKGRLDITNIFPAVEYALRSVAGKDVSMVEFAGAEQVFPSIKVITDAQGVQYAVGDVNPVTLDAVGMSAMVEARRRMVAGEDPEFVIADYVNQFGFSGEFSELAGHIALDPLNVLPKWTTKGVGVVARIGGDLPLARAFLTADTPIHGFKQYQNFVRQGVTGAADANLSASLFVRGLTENGLIKELTPEVSPMNPVKRAWAHLAGLTPEAKTRAHLSMSVDNVNNLIEFRRGDVFGQGDLIRAITNETPTKMAGTAAFLGSPEIATVRQALASYIPKLDELENIYKGTTQHRVVLDTVKQVTGLDEPTILKLAGDADTADNLMTLLKDKAAAIGDENLQALVDGTTTGDLRQIMDAFTGDNPAPWHPDEYSARLSVSLGEHIADWGIKNFGVEKPGEVQRFWGTLKRAQSVVLLGYNPAYAVNNILNNTVTRVATGNWGYASPAKIASFWDDFGYAPYRAEAGVGIGGPGPDIAVGQPGETAIRAAATPERAGVVQKAIDIADKPAFATKISGWFEKTESMQSFFAGTRKFLNHNWVRGKGFQAWSSELKSSMQAAYPGVKDIDNVVYSVIEGSPNRTIAEQRLTDMFGGKGPSHDVDVAISRVAEQLGQDPGMVRDTVSIIYDDLKANLDGAVTADDYSMAYAKTKNDLQSRIMERLSEDLQTRYEQVTTQVGGGNFAEASRIFTEAQLTQAEFWLTDMEANQVLADKAWAMRDAGVDESVINNLYRQQRAESNLNWKMHRQFERATWLGFLESMGAKDVDTRAFLAGTDGNATIWNNYFDLVESRRAEHFGATHETRAAQRRARIAMEKLNEADYMKAHDTTTAVQGKIDDIFVKANRAKYGDEAAAAAKVWKDSVRDIHTRRAMAQLEHRRNTVGMGGKRRQVANQKFWSETYMPIIKDLYRLDIELSSKYSRTVAGDVPITEFGQRPMPTPEGPPGAPPAEPIITPAPDITPPGPGEVPIMLTQNLRDRLANMGYSPEEIHTMKPSEAWRNISEGRPDVAPTPAPPVGEVPEPGAFTRRGTAAERIQLGKNRADEVRALAAKDYGIGTIDVAEGVVGADLDLVLRRTLEKYGGREINSLNDISPAEARKILDARKQAKEWAETGKAGGMDIPEREIVQRSIDDVVVSKYRQAAEDYINGSIRELEPALQVAIRWEAQRMLKRFESGRGDRVKPIITESGQKVFRKLSDNVEWYRKMEASSQKRGTMSNTLDRIINPDSERWVNLGGDVPRGKMTTLQRVKSVVIGKLLGFVDEADMPGPPSPGWLLHVGDEAGALSAFKEWVDLGAVDYTPDEMMRNLALDTDGFNHMWELWDTETVSMREPEPTSIIPTDSGLAGDALLDMYLKKLTDIEAMKQAAEELTGVKMMPSDEPSAIVPVGEQGMIPVEEVAPVTPDPHGNYPPAYVESVLQPRYESQTGFDYYASKVSPLLDSLESQAINDVRTGGIPGLDMAPAAQGQLKNWMNNTWGDMATNKIAALRWGETLRDEALLNYSRKRGADNFVNPVFPYQYWYTRSMLQWGLRAIDRPAWFANYSRLRNFMTQKEESPGFPSRLRGKVAVPAPYLPDWAGGNVWIDPMRKLFPIEEFTNSISQSARQAGQDTRSAEYWLVRQYNDGAISQQDVLEAFQTKTGPNWDMAVAEVHKRNEEENAHPESWITTLMSPAAYLTYPIAMITGKDPFTGEEPGTLPITRTGMALETVTKDTPLQAIGKIIGGAMAAPERSLRGWRGMSEFGGWGDYYMDRQITNLVGEGLISPREGNQAMIERSGEIWEQARERVQFEQMLKTPGALPLYAMGRGANAEDIAAASLLGLMPANLLPDGELVHRGIKEKYNTAREKYNMGDMQALGDFYDEYPKYETRTALYQEPEERMRNFLISDMWDAYSDLSGLDKKMVQEEFGPAFSEGFLNDQTRNYDTLDNETLATWLRSMGQDFPDVPELQGVSEQSDINFPLLEYANPEDAGLVDAYRSERNQLFPSWFALQSRYYEIPKGGGSIPGATDEQSANIVNYRADRNSKFPGWFETQSKYFDLPQGQRSSYLQQHPELTDYWEWSRGEKKKYPEIKEFSGVSREGGPRAEFLRDFPDLPAYWDWNKAVKSQNPQIDYYTNPEKYDDREPPPHAAYNMGFVRDFTPGLTRQLFDYYYADQPLSAGTTGELMEAWQQNDRPGGSYDEFIESILRGVVAP